MKTTPIAPARIEIDADGTPFDPETGDVYHARQGALEQARHVFLAGNGLPARWRRRDRFVVLETGFGLGNNFLAAWLAWLEDEERSATLCFISIDSRPPLAADLAALPRDAALAPLASQLVASWPPLTANLHRLAFAAGRVQLLLALGDVAAWLPQIEAEVDAFFLDGYAPSRNPRMWDARLFKAMARIAAPDATAATWSVARPVRDGLRAAGFLPVSAPGSGGKREITVARFAPRFVPRGPPRRRALASRASHVEHRPVCIVGAGLAGCSLACALAEQGIGSIVFERGSKIAGEGSGNVGGLFHGVVHRDDTRHARYHRAAALEARRQVGVAIASHGVAGATAGLLRLQGEGTEIAAMHATIAELGLPADYVRAVTEVEASELAGVALDRPAWFYPGGGWVDPRGLARAYLEQAAQAVELRLDSTVAGLHHDGDGRWLVVDMDGRTLAAADCVVLANGGGVFDLLESGDAPLERRRGQVSAMSVSQWPGIEGLRLPIAGAGYALPAIDGTLCFGATSRPGDSTIDVSLADHRENLARLGQLLAGIPAIDPDRLGGRVSFRYSAVDRLPLVGAVPLSTLGRRLASDFARLVSPRPEQPRFAPRAPGLFMFTGLGSRGIASSALGARVLAACLAGGPAPLESDLLDAIDPARFASRAVRRALPAAGPGVDQPPVGSMLGSAGA